MNRLPYNIERVRDGRGYRYRGYARDGFCCRLEKRDDGLWHIVAVSTGHYMGKAASLVGVRDILALNDVHPKEEF